MPNGWENTGELSPLTSIPHQYPYQGQYRGVGQLPGFGDNMLMQGAGQLLGGLGIQSAGMLPLGGGPRNIYSRMRDYQMTQLHDEMMRNEAQRERGTWMRSVRGGFAMLGIPWDAPQQELAGAGVDLFSAVAPMLASNFPDFVDLLGGRRGSGLALAEYAFRGGQHRLDPVTGQVGMTGESIQNLVRGIRKTMYDRGPDQALTRDVGFSMGEQGQLFAELQRRGMVAGPSRDPLGALRPDGLAGVPRYTGETEAQFQSDMSRQTETLHEVLRRQYQAEGQVIPRDKAGRVDLEAIQQDRPMMDRIMGDMQMQEVTREFDTRKIISSLENYGGAIKAMREIFGDAGNPNAPVPELINAINALTGNAMAQMDPSRVEMMVRTTYALAEATGVGFQGMAMLSQQADLQAQALGLNPIFANVGVQGALAFRQAAQNAGLGGYQAWGRGDIDDFTQMEQTLQLNAAGSAAANRAGAALRIREAMAAPGEATPFAEDSPVEKWMRALRSGQRSVTLDFGDGKGERTVGTQLNDSDFMAMMRTSATQSGVALTDATIAEMMSQRQQNQRLIFEQGLTPIIRNLQPNEAINRVFTGGQGAAAARVAGLDLDIDSKAEVRLVNALSQAVAVAIPDVTPEIATDPGRLRQHLAEQMRNRLEAAKNNPRDPLHAEASRVLEKFRDEKELDQWLNLTAESMQGAINENLQDSVYENLQGLFVMQNKQNLGDAATQAFRATVEAQTNAAMAAFGTGSPARRAIETIITGADDDGANILEVLGSMVGGVPPEELAPELRERLQDLRKERQKLDATVQKWEGAGQEERGGIVTSVEAQAAVLEESARKLAAYMEQAGILDTTPMASPAGFVDPEVRDDVGKIAAALGMDVDKLMSVPRDEFDTLMESDKISDKQTATVRRVRDEVDKRVSTSAAAENKVETIRKAIRQTETRATEAERDLTPTEVQQQRKLRGELEEAEAAASNLQSLTGPSARTPETIGEGADGKSTLTFNIAQLILNGRDMGSAVGTGESEKISESGEA